MPIMAAHDERDARGPARLIAVTAKQCIEEAKATSTEVPALNNVFRLLEAYRSHRFVGYDFEPRSSRGPEALTLLPSSDRHVLELRDAIGEAIEAVYGSGDTDAAIRSIEGVLRSVAYPAKQTSVKEERDRASRFLGVFIEHLYPAAT
jgi:hypothetical protein